MDVSAIQRVPAVQTNLSTTKARSTAISRTDPDVDLVGASIRAEWDDIIGAPVQEYEVAFGFREYHVVALDAHSMYAQKCLVDLVNHLERDLEAGRVVLVDLHLTKLFF